jgi:hypothetical protein
VPNPKQFGDATTNLRHRIFQLSILAAKGIMRAMLCVPNALNAASSAKEVPKVISLAAAVADGRPWKVNNLRETRICRGIVVGCEPQFAEWSHALD